MMVEPAALLAVLSFSAGHNAAMVVLGAGLFGLAAGATGAFIVLRRRALASDAASHASLPGLCLAFLATLWFGGEGKFLPALLLGAGVSAGLGLFAVDRLVQRTRLPEDAALGVVLSSFFGAGIVLLTLIQTLPRGQSAGLGGFLIGSAAGMLTADALLIGACAVLCLGLLAVFFRPLTLVAFDADFARTLGIRQRRMDGLVAALTLTIVVVGGKIVGIVLVVALLIIPPVAARFWTDRMIVLVPLAGAIGAISGVFGAAFSASATHLPTGPSVVLVAAGLFLVSLTFGAARGLAIRTGG